MHIDLDAIATLSQTLSQEGWSGDEHRLHRLLYEAATATAVRLFIATFTGDGLLRDAEAVEKARKTILDLAASFRIADYEVGLGVPTITFFDSVSEKTDVLHAKAVLKHRLPNNWDGRSQHSRRIVIEIERWTGRDDVEREEIVLT